MSLFKELVERRVPQIIGSYLFASSSSILFIAWLIDRYALPDYYITLALIALIAILPSVSILAYTHGKPGRDRWGRLEKFSIPINMVFLLVCIYIYQNNIHAKEKIVISAKKEKILFGKLFNDDEYIPIIENFIQHNDLSDKYPYHEFSLEKASDSTVNSIYNEVISSILKRAGDNIDVFTDFSLDKYFSENGEIMPFYGMGSEIYLIKNNFDSNSMKSFSNIQDSTINNLLYLSKIRHGFFSYIYKLKNSIGHENLLYGIFYRKWWIEKIDTTFLDDREGYQLSFNPDFGFSDFEPDIASIDEISEKIVNKYFENENLSQFTSITFEGVITDVYRKKVIVSFNDKYKNSLKNHFILETSRRYRTDEDGKNKRITDLEAYGKKISSLPMDHEARIKYNDVDNLFWSGNEMNSLVGNSHILCSGFTIENESSLNIQLKIEQIYDSTLNATIIKVEDPYIELKIGDIVNIK